MLDQLSLDQAATMLAHHRFCEFQGTWEKDRPQLSSLGESPNPTREERNRGLSREYSVLRDVLKLLAADGLNGLGEAVSRLINEAPFGSGTLRA